MPRPTGAAPMPRHGVWAIGLLLLLGLGLKLERYGAQPLGPEAAAAGRLAEEMQAAGWQALGDRPLLSDGSLAAHGFSRGGCRVDVVLLPPGPDYLAVVREAWGDRAVLADDDGAAGQGRLAAWAGQLAWAVGLGGPPVLFRRVVVSHGDCQMPPAYPR